MKCYLVGGAVRDTLLGLPVKERDWVVVGATPEDLLSQGYQRVGKSFPVFLHPETKEEYALARTEKKVAPGYQGFVCDFSPEVTLEEDLSRRDLTINAIAQDAEGHLIDPYHGIQDIQAKQLRHVSIAFVEDPVRLLRVARFAARFQDFSIATETLAMMKAMVDQGEVNALVSERVWQEWLKALVTNHPQRFFFTLRDCSALPHLFPQIAENLESIGCLLEKVAPLTNNIMIRFAIMLSVLHQKDLQKLLSTYGVPKDFYEFACLLCHHANQVFSFDLANKKQILDFFYQADAFRRKARFVKLLAALTVLGKVLEKEQASVVITALEQALKRVSAFVPDYAFMKTLSGQAIADYFYQQRLALL